MPKVFLAGDHIIDEYIYGSCDRVSPEAPVLVVKEERREEKPGGAANVKANLIALGADVDFYGEAPMYSSKKTRIIVQGQQTIRIDDDCDSVLDPPVDWEDRIREADIVMVADYGKGTINDEFIEVLSTHAWKHCKKVLIDPYPNKYKYGSVVTLITPNKAEVESVVGFSIYDDDTLIKAGHRYMDMANAQNVLVTLGPGGMAFFDREQYNKKPFQIESEKQEITDVTGAGDTVFAVMGYIWSHPKFSKQTSVKYANKAAGIAVSRFGCATVTKEEIFGDGIHQRML
jgi:D-beta-D-heptose 7-phosphate kinase/D-beta-D-heptose 1-phosphate adenosyltransferase